MCSLVRVWDLTTQDEQEFLHGITSSLAASRANIVRTDSLHQERTHGAALRSDQLLHRMQEHTDWVASKTQAEAREAELFASASTMRLSSTVQQEDTQRTLDCSRQHAGTKRKAEEALMDASHDVEDLQAKRRMLDQQIETAAARRTDAMKVAESARILSAGADEAVETSTRAAVESTKAREAAEEAHTQFKAGLIEANWMGKIALLSTELLELRRVDGEEQRRDMESGQQLEGARKQLSRLHRSLVEIGAVMSADCGTSEPKPQSLTHSGVDGDMFDSNSHTPTHASGEDQFGDNLLDNLLDSDDLLHLDD